MPTKTVSVLLRRRREPRWRGSGDTSEHARRRWRAARVNFRTARQQGQARQRTGNACQALPNDARRLWRGRATPGIDRTNHCAERALRPYVIGRKTSCFSQAERGNLLRARVMTLSESGRRRNRCADTWLRQVGDQGIRKDPITFRRPIDQHYRLEPSRQLEHHKAA